MQEVVFAGVIPKGAPEENEDYYRAEIGVITENSDPIVISDGASESYDSRTWAMCLVEAYSAKGRYSGEVLQDAQVSYENVQKGRKLSWAQEMAAERGSFATLLSYEYLESKNINKLQVYAVGDSCAVLLREAKEGISSDFSWPYSTGNEFNAPPLLLATRPDLNRQGLQKCASLPGWLMGEHQLEKKSRYHLLLLTDAIAKWVIENKESKNLISDLLAIRDQEFFGEFVHSQRKNGSLKLDDTTMIHVVIETP